MERKSADFQFCLKSIKEIEFFFDQDAQKLNSIQDNQLELNFGQGFIPGEKDVFTYIFGVAFLFEGRRLLETRLAFEFEIKEDKSQNVVFDGDTVIVDDTVMPLILNVCIGTLRGVLVAKTAGTKLADFPLPIVDPALFARILKPVNS